MPNLTTEDYSTKKISDTLMRDVSSAIKSVSEFGSVELYVQGGVVTQITTRTIKKTAKQNNKTSV